MRDHLSEFTAGYPSLILSQRTKTLQGQQPSGKKKSTNNKFWRQCGEKGMLLYCWWKYKMVQLPWRTICRLLRKLKQSWHMVQQSYSWVYTQKRQKLAGKNIYTSMFRVALFTIAKMWKRSKYPTTDEWIKKMWCVCIGIHTNFITQQ